MSGFEVGAVRIGMDEDAQDSLRNAEPVLKNPRDVERHLRSRIQTMESTFADHCEEKAAIEDKIEALHQKRIDLEGRIGQLKMDVEEEAMQHRTYVEQLKEEIMELSNVLGLKDQEKVRLAQRVEDLCSQRDRVVAETNKNGKKLSKARKTLRIQQAALRKSIEGEKHFQARVSGLVDDTKERQPLVVRFDESEDVAIVQEEKVHTMVGHKMVASEETPEERAIPDISIRVSASPEFALPGASEERVAVAEGEVPVEGVMPDGEHNRMILRLFKQLLQEWFAQSPEELQRTPKKDGGASPRSAPMSPRSSGGQPLFKTVDNVPNQAVIHTMDNVANARPWTASYGPPGSRPTTVGMLRTGPGPAPAGVFGGTYGFLPRASVPVRC